MKIPAHVPVRMRIDFDPPRMDALVTPCGAYRYYLERIWCLSLPALIIVMLNPSTADAMIDDPTIKRCMHFAFREGYGGIFVVNLFAFRATDPTELDTAEDTVGPDGDMHLEHALYRARRSQTPILCAWGADKRAKERGQKVIDAAHRSGVRMACLGTTNDGSPKHPLYLSGQTALVPFQAN